MSGNSAKESSEPVRKVTQKGDTRVRRTRNALGDALVDLMQEKRFEDITVQQVLDRAGVGRSTFYAHYTDKEDLFLSDVEEFLEMMASALSRSHEQSRRVAPIREFFAHVGESRKLRSAVAEAGKMGDFLQLAQGCFARGIERRLKDLEPASTPAARAVRAHMLAGAMFSLLSWWLDRGMPNSAAEMDAEFHRLVWPKPV